MMSDHESEQALFALDPRGPDPRPWPDRNAGPSRRHLVGAIVDGQVTTWLADSDGQLTAGDAAFLATSDTRRIRNAGLRRGYTSARC
jgi:hypothetical protein